MAWLFIVAGLSRVRLAGLRKPGHIEGLSPLKPLNSGLDNICSPQQPSVHARHLQRTADSLPSEKVRLWKRERVAGSRAGRVRSGATRAETDCRRIDAIFRWKSVLPRRAGCYAGLCARPDAAIDWMGAFRHCRPFGPQDLVQHLRYVRGSAKAPFREPAFPSFYLVRRRRNISSARLLSKGQGESKNSVSRSARPAATATAAKQ